MLVDTIFLFLSLWLIRAWYGFVRLDFQSTFLLAANSLLYSLCRTWSAQAMLYLMLGTRGRRWGGWMSLELVGANYHW